MSLAFFTYIHKAILTAKPSNSTNPTTLNYLLTSPHYAHAFIGYLQLYWCYHSLPANQAQFHLLKAFSISILLLLWFLCLDSFHDDVSES